VNAPACRFALLSKVVCRLAIDLSFKPFIRDSFSLQSEEDNYVKPIFSKWPTQIGGGTIAAAAIVYADNFAFEGEVSPILIVAMLLAATAIAGAMWGRSAWIAAAVTWACVPCAHLVKRVLGLPDTLHPNTYTSILYLAAFTLVVAISGTACGALIRKLATGLNVRE
jgi:hypothetical protein